MSQADNLAALGSNVNTSGVLQPAGGGTGTTTATGTGSVVLSSGATLTNATINGAVASGFTMKNRIINGDMRIDQRNAGASVATTVTGNSTYTLDRWAYYCDQASKFTVQKTPSTTETGFSERLNAGFTDYLACTSTSNYSVISTDTLGVFQIIEAANIADLAWGTANAKTITLSFWAYSSITGTHAGSIRNANGYNLSYVFTYSIPVANTWTKINLTIAGPTTGTWLTSGQGATIYFNVGAGSNSQTTAGIWTVGNKTSTSGAVNIVGTNGATFYVTGVQLEQGSAATSFEWLPYGTELALCQRYYEKSYDITTAVATNTFSGMSVINISSSSYPRFNIWFRTTKRTNPTAIAYTEAGTLGSWNFWNNGSTGTSAWSNVSSTLYGFNVELDNATTFSSRANAYGHWAASAEL